MIKQASHPQYRSIGLRSIGGLSWLVDPDDINKLVPIGALGEIVFESHELATGYLNDPEGTAKAFIDTPPWARTRSSSRPPRFLRMGDLGKYEVDGSMTIFGRRDTQIKARLTYQPYSFTR
jgi:non-ribosomal peptide synthetase component F